jgi:putative MATE family efflux protein
MGKNRRARLTEGPIAATLVKLTLPMIVGIVGMVAFNLVDTFFIGRLGTRELAAMSFTFPVVMVIGSLARGLGVGASAVLARAIGEGDRGKMQRLATDGLLLSFLVVVVFVVAGMLTIDPLFRLLGADEETLPLIRKYMRIWYPGVAFVVIPMVGNSEIRATGDTRTPSIIMVVAIIVNLTFDPLLIFGIGPFPRLELEGAAIATVMARAVTMTVSLIVLSKREKLLIVTPPKLNELLDSWIKVLYIGLPAAGTFIIIPFATGIITRIVSVYGAASVAGFGVASRIEQFALTVISALATVLIPFIGQNLGAGKGDRIRSGLRFSQLLALAWGVLLFVAVLFFGRPISKLFNEDPQVVEAASLYLLIVSVSYGAFGLFNLLTSAFNAMNRPLQAASLSLFRVFALYVPLAAVGSRMFELRGVFGAATAANLVSALIAFLWMARILRKTSQIAGERHENPG